MSLQDILNETKKSFDPKKDRINESSFDNLPEGTYTVTLDNVNHFVSQTSNFEQLSFKMMVIDGEYAGRLEFVGVNLATKKKDGSPMPDFVVTKNMRLLVTIGALVGLTITDEMVTGNETDVYEKLQEAFIPHKGKLLEMTIKESRNKKDPENPFRNYEFAEAKDEGSDSFTEDESDVLPADSETSSDEIEVDEDDLPF